MKVFQDFPGTSRFAGTEILKQSYCREGKKERLGQRMREKGKAK